MAIIISADDPRSIKALEIAAGASQWLRCRTAEGEVAWGVPSQCEANAGRYYLVTTRSCDCPDFQKTGLSHPRLGAHGDHGLCKHIRALLIRDELVRAQEIERRPRPRLRAVPRPTETYRDPLICEECDCFLSKHDTSCSHWTQTHDTQRED